MDFLTPATALYCALVLLAGYALRGSTGFGGFAAMPLLAFVVPIKVLVPVWTLLTIASSAAIVAKDRRSVETKHLWRIVPTALIGIAVGLVIFTHLDAALLARAFGAFVLGYGLWSWWRGSSGARDASRGSRIAGDFASFFAGAMGTVFGTMASIFFAIYLDVQRIARRQFRGTLAAMMLIMGLARGVGYFLTDTLGWDAVKLFALAFPLTVLGLALGDRIHVRLSERTFHRVVCAILVASGSALLLKG